MITCVLPEFGGDIDRIATYALTLPTSEPVQVPQVECIEEQLSDVSAFAFFRYVNAVLGVRFECCSWYFLV